MQLKTLNVKEDRLSYFNKDPQVLGMFETFLRQNIPLKGLDTIKINNKSISFKYYNNCITDYTIEYLQDATEILFNLDTLYLIIEYLEDIKYDKKVIKLVKDLIKVKETDN